MNSNDLHTFDLHDDDLRRRFDAIAARADMPVVDPLADLRRARDARRRRRLGQAGGGLVAAAAVSALVIGNLSGSDPDAGGNIADDPSPGVIETPRVLEQRPELLTFRRNISEVLGADQLGATGETGSAVFDNGAVSLVSFEFLLPRGVTVDVRAGVSREVLEWKYATDTNGYAVDNRLGEQGLLNGRTAFIYDQPDGDVVLVAVGGPRGDGPSPQQIETLLTDLEVPASTLTPAEVWQDKMLSIGLDALHQGDLSIGTPEMYTALPSVLADAYQGKRKTGLVEWQAQTITADSPDCPAGFTNCGTMQIAGETFRSLYVEGGERAGWLYLERDHGDVRAQMILEPYEEGWALPLEAAAELLLDGRWSELAPESSVPYPAS